MSPVALSPTMLSGSLAVVGVRASRLSVQTLEICGLEWRSRHMAPAGLLERTLTILRSVAQNTDPEPLAVGGSVAVEAPNAAAGPPGVNAPSAIAAAATQLSMEDLIRDHADAVYRVALSVTRDPMLAEDASQDALIKAWQSLPSFRGESPLRNWILRITHNTSISLLRKRRDELRDPDELPETVAGSSVEAQVQDRMAIDRFELALRELDSLSRSIVVLREVEGLSYDEMCDVLQLPMPTVKTRLLRARRQLAVALDGWQP